LCVSQCADRLHKEVSTDYNDVIYAASKPEIEAKCKAFIRKWRLAKPQRKAIRSNN
jgi:putative transposase